MGIIYELYVECLKETDAEQVVAHFLDLKFDLVTGRSTTWYVDREYYWGGQNIFGFSIFSGGLSQSGISNVQDAVEATESGLRLYNHLKNGPEFDFAHARVEAEGISMTSLSRSLRPVGAGKVWLDHQCILSNNIYEKLGRPKNFVREFRPGYRWNRYLGEEYSKGRRTYQDHLNRKKYFPLLSPDQEQLNDVCKQIFPELFESDGWEEL